MIGQFVYLRALVWTNFFIGRLVFESLPRPFLDLIVFAGSVRRWSGGVRDWSMSMETVGLGRMCCAFL